MFQLLNSEMLLVLHPARYTADRIEHQAVSKLQLSNTIYLPFLLIDHLPYFFCDHCSTLFQIFLYKGIKVIGNGFTTCIALSLIHIWMRSETTTMRFNICYFVFWNYFRRILRWKMK